jgi:hypothetical protein
VVELTGVWELWLDDDERDDVFRGEGRRLVNPKFDRAATAEIDAMTPGES